MSLTTPDQAVVSTSYSGNMVLVTDQALKKRISQTNGLGQLTQVWEVTPSDSWTTSVMFNGQNYTAYQSSYLYDALDDLAKVTQGGQSRYFMYDSLKRLIRARNPEQDTNSSLTLTDPVTGNNTWCVSYEYDNNSNLFRKTDSRSPAVVTTNISDTINRIVSHSYSDSTPAVSYKYDGAGATGGVLYSRGRLTLVSSSVSSYSYDEYDQTGRVKRCTQTTASQPYLMSYAYDLAGHVTSETYPSGRQVITEYDSAGRIAGVKKDATTYYAGGTASDAANRIQYAPQGAVSVMKLGNGKWEHTNFNNRLQPTQIGLGTSGTDSSVLKLDYGYGTTTNNGNVMSQTITIGSTVMNQTYGYDALNRLSSASENSGASWSQSNGFDRYGNRWVSGYVVPGNESRTPPSQSAFNAATNRINAAVMPGFGYDGAGNVTSDPTTPAQGVVYDGENRQVSYTKAGATTTYSYDGDGRRVKKVVGSVTTVFVYNASGQLIAEYTNDTTPPVGGGGTSYLTSDHLGSTRVVMKSDGSVKARYDYLPFGEEIPSSVGGRSSVAGYGGGDSTKQKFTQKERDTESGLDYLLARYYSSAQGRFTSPDKPLAAHENDPQSWNAYPYARNNPMLYVDPTGQDFDFYVNGNWYRVKDASEFEKYGYTVYGGNDDGTVLYIRDAKGNRYSAQFADVPVNDPVNVQAQYEISATAESVGFEMNRRAQVSQDLIVGIAAVNLAPAVLAATTLSGGSITTLGPLTARLAGPATAAGGVLSQLGRTDASIFEKAAQYGASATNSFANNLSALAQAVRDFNPSYQVNKIGQIGNSTVWGSIPTRVGIADVNGVTMVIKMIGDTPKILGPLP